MIIFTESSLNDTFFDSELFSPQYTVIRRDRQYAELDVLRGGGVLIATLNKLKFSLIETPIVKEYDDLWIRLLLADGIKLVVGCVYLPPNSSLESYQSFCSTCESLRNTYENHRFLIYGDFNQPLIKWMEENRTAFAFLRDSQRYNLFSRASAGEPCN